MKKEQLITVAPFYFLITHHAISYEKSDVFYFYSTLVSKATSV